MPAPEMNFPPPDCEAPDAGIVCGGVRFGTQSALTLKDPDGISKHFGAVNLNQFSDHHRDEYQRVKIIFATASNGVCSL